MNKFRIIFYLIFLSFTAFSQVHPLDRFHKNSLRLFLENPPKLNMLAYKHDLSKFKMADIDKAIEEGDLDEDEVYADFKYFGQVDDIIKDFNKHASCENSCELLNDEQKVALYTYTMYFFAYINPVLRGNNLTDKANIAPLVDNMSSALQTLPPYSGLVYRGVGNGNFLKKYTPGQIVVEKAFTSTSAKDEMINFFKWPVVMKIQSKSGRLIKEFSAAHEDEVLFDKNTRFKVLSRRIINKRIIIEMEEVESNK